MKKIPFLMTIAVVTTTWFACNDDDKNEAENPYDVGFPSLADMYYTPTSIKVRDVATDSQFPYVIIDVGYNDEKTTWFNAKDENEKSTFEKYANSLGDTLGNVEHPIPHTDFASVVPVLTVDVISDSQFDETHPAGSSLNDLMYIYNWRDYGYANDYKREHDAWIYGQDELRRGLDSISTTNQIAMLGNWFRLHFKKAPAAPGTYKFTVSMKFGADPLTGETVEIEPVTVEIEFK